MKQITVTRKYIAVPEECLNITMCRENNIPFKYDSGLAWYITNSQIQELGTELTLIAIIPEDKVQQYVRILEINYSSRITITADYGNLEG
jgi:hypothetical protein